jgi:hypothetical protein
MPKRPDGDEAHQSDREATRPDHSRKTMVDAIAQAKSEHESHKPVHLRTVPDSEKSLSEDEDALRRFLIDCGTAIGAEREQVESIFIELIMGQLIRSVKALERAIPTLRRRESFPVGLLDEIQMRLAGRQEIPEHIGEKPPQVVLGIPSAGIANGVVTLMTKSVIEKPRLRWLPEKTRAYTVMDCNLKFVNRTHAVSELFNLHRCNFATLDNGGAGAEYRFALIDNLRGMGKSTFGRHYISTCRSRSDLPMSNKPFVDSLTRARTLTINLMCAELSEHIDEGKTRCQDALRDEFVKTVSQRITWDEMEGNVDILKIPLSDVHSNSFVQCVERFIKESGSPLFLVLDEIGKAFTRPSLTLEQQRTNFLKFCSEVLGETLFCRDLYLLLIGNAGFLSLVANRTPTSPESPASAVMLERIGLCMIRKQHIGEILDFTHREALDQDKAVATYGPCQTDATNEIFARNGRPLVTLSRFYGLEGDSNKKIRAIDAILKATNGHPRWICTMLRSCETFGDLEAYLPEEGLKDHRVKDWIAGLLNYTRGLEVLFTRVEDGRTMDLGKKVFTDLEKSCTYMQLANWAYLRYEGTIDAARLFASEFINRNLSLLFRPFRAFIEQFDHTLAIRYKHEANFELCCLKRFQEMFGEAVETPEKRFPCWFSGTRFGMLRDFRLGTTMGRIPKITERGSGTFDELAQATAKPDHWPSIRAKMLECELPRAFIPADLSASSDVIIMTKAFDGKDQLLVTIGLAVKCTQSPLALDGANESVAREQELFNRMFVRSSSALSELNVLIICASGGFAGCSNSISSKILELSTSYPNVHETILLNLSDMEKRANFFGLNGTQGLIDKIEAMILKQHGGNWL